MRYGLAVAVLLVMAGVCFFVLGHLYWHFVVGSAVLGLSSGGILPVWGALIASLFGGANYGRVMGLMSPIPGLCVVLAIPLTGFLFDWTGAYTAPYLLFIALLGIALCLIPAIVREKP
jgi:MFS family permease